VSDWKPSGNPQSLTNGFSSRLCILYRQKTAAISTTGFQQVSTREGLERSREMKDQLTPVAFLRLLHAAREIDQEFPWLDQMMWLLDCWTEFADGYVGLSLPE